MAGEDLIAVKKKEAILPGADEGWFCSLEADI